MLYMRGGFTIMSMTLSLAASAVRGRHLGPEAVIAGVTTDSRNIATGDLFVALKGERFDGHDFVGVAQERGAVAALVALDRANALPGNGIAVPDLEVDDPTEDAELLMLGWGSSYGPIGEACRRARRKGIKVAHAQLRNLNQ